MVELPKFPFADCESCPLKKRRYTEPDTIGDCQPRIAIVGESPGVQEVLRGKPFQGDTGLILREGVKELGLERYGLFLTNAIPCEVTGIEKGGDAWNKALNACRPRLIEELGEVNSELIVVMGNEAKNSVTPGIRAGIKSLSGEYGWQEELERDVLYTFHPAFILHAREGERYFTMWLDHLNEAKLFFEAEPFEVKTHVAWSVGDVKRFLRELEPHDSVVLDLETTSFSPFDDEWALAPNGKKFDYGRIINVALNGDGANSYIIPGESPYLEEEQNLLGIPEVKQLLAEFLRRKRVVCHNVAFDLPFIWEFIAPDIFATDDTMLKSYSMDETPWHGLKRLGRKYLGVENWAADLSEWLPERRTSYAHVPPDVLFSYGGKDTAVTARLNGMIEMDADSARLYENFLMPISNMFVAMSVKGTRIDPKALVSASRELQRQKDENGTFLRKEFGVTNPNSWIQVYDVLYNDLNLDIPETVKTGKGFLETLAVDEEYKDKVEDWQWDASLFSTAVRSYRSAHKGKNTYVKDVAQSMSLRDLAVHPDYKIFATVTGRIVISNPTLTNYTKGTGYADLIRRPFVSRPGYVWFHYDYKHFELRIYAVISKDAKMTDILINPDSNGKARDPHREVALVIYGPDYDDINRRMYGILRTITKTCVFGRLYGRGPSAMAEQLEIEVAEAQRVCRAIDSFWELERYRGFITGILEDTQEIVNPLGRTRRFPLITEDNFHRCFNQACNYLIQSTASDANLLALHRVWQEFGHLGVNPLFTIHDSGDMEIPEDKFDILVPQILEVLQEYPKEILGNTAIPFKVDSFSGSHWRAE